MTEICITFFPKTRSPWPALTLLYINIVQVILSSLCIFLNWQKVIWLIYRTPRKIKINGKSLINWQKHELKHMKRMENNSNIPDSEFFSVQPLHRVVIVISDKSVKRNSFFWIYLYLERSKPNSWKPRKRVRTTKPEKLYEYRRL